MRAALGLGTPICVSSTSGYGQRDLVDAIWTRIEKRILPASLGEANKQVVVELGYEGSVTMPWEASREDAKEVDSQLRRAEGAAGEKEKENRRRR